MNTTWQTWSKQLGIMSLATLLASAVAWSDQPEQGQQRRQQRGADQQQWGRDLQQQRGGAENWQDPDTNGDGLIDDSEADAAIKRMTEQMRRHFAERNARVLEHFDKDGDGKLSAEELAQVQKVRECLQNRRREQGNAAGEGAKPPRGPQRRGAAEQ